jgi:hypothetical protein
MQQKYAQGGKFTVFLSNVQNFSDEARAFLEKNAPTIPLYEQVRLPHAPCGRGIPHAVLFDHTGQVVAQGSPSELEAQVEALVAATPDPPSGILGEIEPTFCRNQAAQLAAGKPIAPILKNLAVLAAKDNEAGQEAKQLVEAVNAYVQEETERLKEKAESAPARTLCKLNSFAIQVRGMSCEPDIKALAATLRKDRNVVMLATAMQQVDVLQRKIAKQGGDPNKADTSKLANAKESIRKMIAGGKMPEAVAAEAESFLKTF